ncbi:MAG: ABC transporter ATP-binding protein [Streptosporangiaceae bacterium]
MISGPDPIVVAHQMVSGYGGPPVLRAVDLTVWPGDLLAIVGPNGAGKSTLVSTIAGLVPLTSGTILVRGRDVGRLRPEERVLRGLALVPEGRRLFAHLTVKENLRVGGWRRGTRTFDRVVELLPALSPILDRPAGALPVALQGMCAIGRALMSQPAVLFVDEPSLGLPPDSADELAMAFPDLAATGIAVVVVETDVARALTVAERVMVMEHGRAARAGTPGVLLSDAGFVESYVWGRA